MIDIDVGDYVYHAPSGEEWVVALVSGDRLYWCGYPFGGSAELSDCILVDKATEERRNYWINKLASTNSDALPVLKARERRAKIDATLAGVEG